MKEKLQKMFSILIIALMVLSIISNFIYAVDPTSYSGTTTFSGSQKITTVGNKIIGAIQLIGTIVAVAILVVLGIKYMMGSAEEKAEYKKTMVPYVIGAIIVFAASNIAKWVYDAAKGVAA